MSHSVTITRTVTSSNTTSTLVLNTGYIKTVPGLLKLAQLVISIHFLLHRPSPRYFLPVILKWAAQKKNSPQIIGAICVGIVAYYYDRRYYHFIPDLFFLLMATAFLIGTFCLLVSCLFSLSTGGIISKTIYVTKITCVYAPERGRQLIPMYFYHFRN